MKAIAAFAAVSAALLVVGPLAYAGGHTPGQAAEIGDLRTRVLRVQHPYAPLICLDSYPVAIAALGDFWDTADEPECRPVPVPSARDLQE